MFHLFDKTHLTALLAIGLLLYFAIKVTLKLPKIKIDLVVKIVAVVLPIVELLRIIWIYNAGETELIKLLPLHLCGTQIVFIPLAVFTKKTAIKEFVFATSLLGGVAAILALSGIADTYPFWHFQTLQSIILHMILIFVPLMMILGQGFQPQLKNFPKALGILVGVGLVAGVVDVAFGQNYMFLIEPPMGTPLVAIFDNYGKGVYLTILVCAISLGMYLVYLPFRQKKCKVAPSLSHKTVD